jgi:hemolysin III
MHSSPLAIAANRSAETSVNRHPEAAHALTADRWVHITGLLLGGAGAAALVARVIRDGRGIPLLVYGVCLVTMLVCSAVYNLAAPSERRQVLRRLDHAAIFLLIAGTYTPFTARDVGGAALAVTALVWAVALAGVVGKLTVPHRFERSAILVYLGLGWAVLIGFRPLVSALDPWTIGLLAAGGVLYTAGIVFYLWQTLTFHRAIWHLFVLAAAACHYTAVVRTA